MPAEVGASPFYVDTRGLVPYARRIPNTRHLPFASERIWLPWVACPGPRKMGKVPIQLNGRTGGHANPAVLVTALDAAAWAHRHPKARIWVASRQAREVHPVAGLLLNVLPGSPYAGIDLDDCRDAESGVIQPWAAEIIDATKDFLYWEVSPGLQGLRGIGYGAWNIQRQTLRRPDGGAIELYDGSHGARALTFTGLHLPGTEPFPRTDVTPERLAALAASILPPGSETATVYPVEAGPVPAFQALELDDLRLDDLARHLITEGTPEGADRSATLHFLAVNLLRLGNAPEAVACLLADERYPISRAAWDRRGTRTGALTWVWKYIVTPARNEESGLTAAFAELEEAEAGEGIEGEDDEDPAEAPVAPQLERLWRLRRVQAREGLELAARSLAERTKIFTSVQEALDDPAVMTLNAGTGIGKTYTLANVKAAVALMLVANAPPVLFICGTSTHNVDNFYKEVSAALKRKLTARHRANGYDEATAKTIAAAEAAELMQGCARIQHNRAILPFRNREGHYTYRIILCTYAAINRIGDAIDARGRLLRLLAGMRSLEEKHGLESEPILVYGDEADAGLMNARITLSLQFRKTLGMDKSNGKPRHFRVKKCPGRECEKCLYQPKTYAAEISIQGISQLVIHPKLWWMEGTTELTLDWLQNVIGPKQAEDGNYEIYTVLVENLPDIDPMERYLDENGNEHYRVNAEGQIIRWMRQPGATLRRLLPLNRGQNRLVFPHDIQPGDDIQWPSYPCEVWSLVTWDCEAFSDLATLCLSTPKLLSASFSAGTLAMVEHAFGPQEHGQVPTPDDRKMRRIHIAAIPDALSFTEKEVAQLLTHSNVLWVVQTKKQAELLFEIVKAWTSPGIRPAIYSDGALSQIEVFGHNLIITYPRSSLARGANLGHCRTIICHTDNYGALLHELGLGHEDMRVSLEEDNQSNLIQPIGRIMRQDENNPADDGHRMIILRSTTDRDGALIEDGRFLISRMQALSHEVTYSQFNIHPRRVLDAQHEFFTQGYVTRDDAIDASVTTAQLSPRQRRLTADARARAKAAAREERTEARLWELARSGVSWTDARLKTNLTRVFKNPDKVEELKRQYREILQVSENNE